MKKGENKKERKRQSSSLLEEERDVGIIKGHAGVQGWWPTMVTGQQEKIGKSSEIGNPVMAMALEKGCREVGRPN